MIFESKEEQEELARVIVAHDRVQATKIGIHYSTGPLHDLANAVKTFLKAVEQ